MKAKKEFGERQEEKKRLYKGFAHAYLAKNENKKFCPVCLPSSLKIKQAAIIKMF